MIASVEPPCFSLQRAESRMEAPRPGFSYNTPHGMSTRFAFIVLHCVSITVDFMHIRKSYLIVNGTMARMPHLQIINRK